MSPLLIPSVREGAATRWQMKNNIKDIQR